MAKIRIVLSEVGYDSTEVFGESMPETTITLEAEEVWSLQQLEGLFKHAAIAAGFDYVEKVHLLKRPPHPCEGDELPRTTTSDGEGGR